MRSLVQMTPVGSMFLKHSELKAPLPYSFKWEIWSPENPLQVVPSIPFMTEGWNLLTGTGLNWDSWSSDIKLKELLLNFIAHSGLNPAIAWPVMYWKQLHRYLGNCKDRIPELEPPKNQNSYLHWEKITDRSSNLEGISIHCPPVKLHVRSSSSFYVYCSFGIC